MDNIVSIFFFLAIFMFITGLLYNFLLRNKDIQNRFNYYLDIEKKHKINKEEKKSSESLKEVLKNSNEIIRTFLKKVISGGDQKKLNQLIISAGIKIKPEEYVMYRFFTAALMGGIFYLLFNNLILLIVGLIIGFILPRIWINGKVKRKVLKFNDGLADMITTIIGALKSGYSFSQAMKTVAEESETPIKEEIETLIHELNYGITMEEALNNLYSRMPSVDLELMIQATLIQRQIGGNLSTILEIIVETIRERKKLERHVRTLTAQGRLSGKIIGAMPIFIAFFMFILNRKYLMDFVVTRVGMISIAVGVLLTSFAFFIISRITKIEV